MASSRSQAVFVIAFPLSRMPPPTAPTSLSRSPYDRDIAASFGGSSRWTNGLRCPVIGRKVTRLEICPQIQMGPPLRGYVTGAPPFHDPSLGIHGIEANSGGVVSRLFR